MPVLGFFGKYRPFSNFWPLRYRIRLKNPQTGVIKQYDSTEKAYQAAKFLDDEIREQIRLCPTAPDAKKLAKKMKSQVRPDWTEISLKVMGAINYMKYRKHPELKELLLSTGQEYLEETNEWGDHWWGVCNGIGENHLGKILMEIREDLQEEIQCPPK